MEKMEKLISFVSDYVGHLLTVIFGVAAVWFYDPKGKISDTWNAIIKTGTTLLGILVILICYINFSEEWEQNGPGTPTPGQIETSAASTSKDIVFSTKTLPKNDYALIEASSTYNGDLASHIASNLIDNNPKTNWTEGVQGNGEGEYIDFTFHTEQPVAGFIIWAGNHASAEYYTKNARPKTISLTFSDGTVLEYSFLDEKEEHKIYFDNVINTKSIRLTIDSVYPGSKWSDTVISEIAFLVQESE